MQQPQIPVVTKEPQTILQGFADQLDDLIKNTEISTNRIRGIITRILAPPPQPKSDTRNEAAVIPHGSVGTILRQLEDLKQLLTQQSQEIDKLETL